MKTREEWKRLVLSSTALYPTLNGKPNPEHQKILEATLDRLMLDPSEGVWHAMSQVTGRPCSCAVCMPNVRRFT